MGILEMRRHLSNYFRAARLKPTRLKLVVARPELFDTLDSIARRWGDFDVSGVPRCRATCKTARQPISARARHRLCSP
ncbi:MAG: hypothetical protein ACLU5I_10485 [Alistipes finegoldii]